jgi:hypothetical protein
MFWQTDSVVADSDTPTRRTRIGSSQSRAVYLMQVSLCLEEHHGSSLTMCNSGSDRATREKQSDKEKEESIAFHLPRSEPVTSDIAQDGRMRRTTFNPSSVDKVVIKGSMSKVIAGPGHRALLTLNGAS